MPDTSRLIMGLSSDDDDIGGELTPDDASSVKSDLTLLIPEEGQQRQGASVYLRYGENITVRLPPDPSDNVIPDLPDACKEDVTIRIGPVLNGVKSYLDLPPRPEHLASFTSSKSKDNIKVRLPPVSNGVEFDLKPPTNIPEHGQGKASDPLPPIIYSIKPPPVKPLPALPTPEQRKILLERNLKAMGSSASSPSSS